MLSKLLAKIESFFAKHNYHNCCYKEMEALGYACIGKCNGQPGGDANTGWLSEGCIECKYLRMGGNTNMNMTYKQEVVVNPEKELSNKVEILVTMMDHALQGILGEDYREPTTVSVRIENDTRAAGYVFAEDTLLYNFVLKKQHKRDNHWICESDLTQQFGMAIAAIRDPECSSGRGPQ